MGTASRSERADPAVTAVLGLLRRRPPTLGDGRLVCVDGPAGSGKTTLGRALVAATPGARLLHMDDLYDGWSGLDAGVAQLDALLAALAAGEPGEHRRYDWHAGRYAETRTVPPGALLVVEGVGAGAVADPGLVTVLVWVDAPEDVRLRRGLARDGQALADEWRRWLGTERAHFARERTAERADVVVDGLGLAPPRLPRLD